MSNIFRNSTIEKVLSPEKLNKQIKLVTPSFFIFTVALLIITLTAVLWCVFATIPNSIDIKGVVFPQNGISSVVAADEGFVQMLRVNLGQYVKAGEVIAYVPQSKLLSDIKNSTDNEEIERLRKEYNLKSMVLSPVDGQVISIAENGHYLKTGDEIAKIVQDDIYTNNQEVTAFVSQNVAKRLKKGMMVQISPEFAPREQYGYMEGIITRIENYPSKSDDIIKRFGGFVSDTDLKDYDSYIEVKIAISVDPESKNLKKWSNPKGEELDIDVGMNCNISVIIERINPISLFF